MPSSAIRPFRNNNSFKNESLVASERVPFLTQEQSFDYTADLENGLSQPPTNSDQLAKSFTVTRSSIDDDVESYDPITPHSFSTPRWTWRSPSLRHLLLGRRRSLVQKDHILEKCPHHKSRRTTPLRRVIRLLAVALMLL